MTSLYSLAVAQRQVAIEAGLHYGDHPRQRLDIYYPCKTTAVRAIIMFIYGGGWNSGARQMYGFVGTALAARGYLTMIPDYRLYPEVRYPDFMTDAAHAYRWAIDQQSAALTAGTPMILMGHSAGAHMAALLAYDRRYLDQIDGALTSPQGFIGISGPYGFDPKTHHRSKMIFETAASADLVRPEAQVKAGAPAALVMHGDRDTVVMTENAIRFRDTMAAAGNKTTVVVYDNLGHTALLAALSRPWQWRADILAQIDRFITTLVDDSGC